MGAFESKDVIASIQTFDARRDEMADKLGRNIGKIKSLSIVQNC